MTSEQMNAIVQSITSLMSQLNEFWGLENHVLAHPPAARTALGELQTTIGQPLPPSYLQLLRLHDGIEDFYGLRGALLPCSYRKQYPGFEKEWKRPALIFFIADDDWNAVAFDSTTRRSDGEMEVLEIAENIDADRWHSLPAFLTGYEARLRGWLNQELADRSQVDDD